MELACSSRVFDSLQMVECARKARRIGFRSIELDWDVLCRQMPTANRRVGAIREILAETGLTIAGAFAGSITAEREDQLRLQVREVVAAMEAIRDTGAKTVIVTGGARTLENFNCLRDGLQETLAVEAEKLGLEVAVANRAETRVENGQDLLALFSSPFSASIGVCLDVYQCHVAAVNAGDVIREMDMRIRLVRMSDLMGTVPVPFGQGEIEIKGLIRSLRRVSYDGYIVVDHLPRREEKVERELEQAYAYMQGIVS